MGCAEKGACSSGCSGCGKSDMGNGYETAISSIVELEIYYGESEGQEASKYILKSIYCLTNIQTRELRETGLEGNEFESLDEMRQQIIACLRAVDDLCCGSINNIDITYIKDDI